MSVVINNIKPLKEFDFIACTIVLLYTNRIPPHLGIINNKKWYSLSTKGVEAEVNSETILKLVNKKKIPALFVETELYFNDEDLFIYNSFEQLGVNSLTCLSPILSLFKDIPGVNDCKFIFHLLDILKLQRKLKSAFHLNMEDQIIDDSFLLKEYSIHDVRMCISNESQKNNLAANA